MFSTQMAPRPLFAIAATLASAALIGACIAPTDSSHVTPGLAIVSGNGQSGIAGQLLVDPVVVSVGDSTGRPVAGAGILWEVTSGGGAIAESLSYTDITGRSSATWTLGVQGLTQTVQAGVFQYPLNSPASMPPVIFTAAANGAATGLLLVAGDNQAAIVVDTLPVPLRVRALNQAGNGVPGVRVAWTAAGVGQVFPSEALTDMHGEATARWVLGGTVGIQEATATATGLSGSPRTFSATANAAANALTWRREQIPPICPCPERWAGIWATSPSDVFAVSIQGTIRHFNGSSWELQSSGTTNALHAVWGSSPSDVYAAGDRVLLHYDGAAWSPAAGSASVLGLFRGIWASSPSDVFAVSGRCSQVSQEGGTVHYDGSTWTWQQSSSCLGAVWGTSASDVWAVGTDLTHYDGTTWSRLGPPIRSVDGFWGRTGVGGSGPNDVYSVGAEPAGCTRGGCGVEGIIEHYDGTSWQRSLTATLGQGFDAVWVASSTDVIVVGTSGEILHYDGARWRPESGGTTESILGVSGSSERDVWAITGSGVVLHGTR